MRYINLRFIYLITYLVKPLQLFSDSRAESFQNIGETTTPLLLFQNESANKQ